MRICLINEFFYPDTTGGTGTVLSDIVSALREQRQDVEIHVATSRNLYRPRKRISARSALWQGKLFRFSGPEITQLDTARLTAVEDWHGAEIHRLATPRPNGRPLAIRMAANLMFTFAALLHLMRTRPYDLVMVATAPPMVALAASIFKRLTGTPYVYITYDLEPDRAVSLKVVSNNSPFARIFRYIQQKCLGSADRVIALGRCMKAHLLETYRLDPARVDVIPIGLDPETVYPMSKESSFRAANGLKGKFVVLYAGNLGRYHDFDTVLDGAKRLQELRPEIRFVLVGRGVQRQRILERVEREKIDNVALHEFVPREDLSDLMATADVSLVTLEPGMEGLCVPSKFYSILASARPVIAVAPAQSEISYVLEETCCGFQINPSDVDKLVRSLCELADHPEEARQMGDRARSAFVADYTAKRVAYSFSVLFDDLLQHKTEEILTDDKVECEPITT